MSKFANIFETADALESPAPDRLEKTVGRPPGKRSDPEYKQYSLLLRRKTQRRVTDILRERDNGQDVSELVQQLLEKWVTEQA